MASDWDIDAALRQLMTMRRNRDGARSVGVRVNHTGSARNVVTLPRLLGFRLLESRARGITGVPHVQVEKLAVNIEGTDYEAGVMHDVETFTNNNYLKLAAPPYVAKPAANTRGRQFERLRRREWVQHLRVYLRLLGYYNGDVDNRPPLDMPTALGEAVVRFWAASTGHPMAEYTTRRGWLTVVELLNEAVAGVVVSDRGGHIQVPLPTATACTVKIRFRGRMLIMRDPEQDTGEPRIVRHDGAWHRLIGTEQPTDTNEFVEEVSVDIQADAQPAVRELFTLTWSQPIWYEHYAGAYMSGPTTHADRERRKQLLPPPGEGINATMLLPTTLVGSGPNYGECGFVRSYSSDEPVRQHGQKWYRLPDLAQATNIVGTYQTEQAARAASNIRARPPTSYRRQGSQWQVVEVSKYYGPFPNLARAQNAKYHPGQDLAGLTETTPVYALTGGLVTQAGAAGAGGQTVILTSAFGGVVFQHAYQHLHQLDVEVGTAVRAGQQLGVVGRTGNIDNYGATPRAYPTHCHFYLKRRASSGSERLQESWDVQPSSAGFFRHKPGARDGPLAQLHGAGLSAEAKACFPADNVHHLLPCGGQPNTNLTYTAGSATSWRPDRCANLPTTIRATGGTAQERNNVRSSCWARQSNLCPWEALTRGNTELSRFIRYEFDGEYLTMLGASAESAVAANNTQAAAEAAEAAKAWQPLKRWRALSGRPGYGRKLSSALTMSTYAKRFDLSAGAQGQRDQGPIPEGEWRIQIDDVISFATMDILHRLFKYTKRSWGDWGVPLIPLDGTNARGRSGFYIHGGTKWGSAGCIDLRENDGDFFAHLRADSDGRQAFRVSVRYTTSIIEIDDEYHVVDLMPLY